MSTALYESARMVRFHADPLDYGVRGVGVRMSDCDSEGGGSIPLVLPFPEAIRDQLEVRSRLCKSLLNI